jgi:sugar O-acyltransferase (sialic acid O-acetyltransferase NeuD family)
MSRNTTRNAVAVLGFHDGSAGQIETWFEETGDYRIECFVHEAADFEVDVAAENRKRVSQRTDFPRDNLFKGRPFLVTLDWVAQLQRRGVNKVLVLTPNNRDRLRQIETCRVHGFDLVSAIHPSVTILSDARIAPGVWINAGSIIGYKAEIEAGVLINTGVQIDHHNVLETCCQVDPGVVTAGYVTVRRCAQVHTGTVVINRIEIGEDAIVGAGAVVIENIPRECTAVGVPARVIKRPTPS